MLTGFLTRGFGSSRAPRCEMRSPGWGWVQFSVERGIMGRDQEVLHHRLHLVSQGNLFKDNFMDTCHQVLRKATLIILLPLNASF